MTWLIALLATKWKVPAWLIELGLLAAAGLWIYFCMQYYAARQRERGAVEAKPGIIKQFEDQKKIEWSKIENRNKQLAEENADALRRIGDERSALSRDKETVLKLRVSADAVLESAKTIAGTRREEGYAQARTLNGPELLNAIRSESAALAAAPK